MRKPEDTRRGYIEDTRGGYITAPMVCIYDQRYVDGLKNEIEHYKKLYRDLLVQKRDCVCN